ncbi:hypothetical protein ASG39_11220 [Rhizobium sp. Leaf371]|uniref:head-tail connector protein n=1 Tax=Rhizobium sp. Leaf371 TaxID=1736355 RepID=UPI000714A3AA|nr:head-tail connector protein [Rhizobium sp. Leaf371]KQS64518.1 hypothetical protein ASG39_11220 [Rhizobium sp. Leaf371]
MTNIVTIVEAKAHLNITDDADDALISSKVEAAEAFVGRWTLLPLASMATVPADLRQAVLMLTGHFYENREATLVGVSADEVPFGVWDLINPHREWSF